MGEYLTLRQWGKSIRGCAVCNISGGHRPISGHLSGMATQINTWAVIRCSGKFMACMCYQLAKKTNHKLPYGL